MGLIGRVDYRRPFYVRPGISHSPQIPVDFDLESTASDPFKAILDVLLETDAVAEFGVRIGNYTDIIAYRGKGIPVHFRI